MSNTLLSIDLDFFVTPKATWMSGNERLAEDRYQCVGPGDAVDYVRTRCGFNDGRVPGAVVRDHHEIVQVIDLCLEGGLLAAPFRLIHLDAHSDSGLGDPGWDFVLRELAWLPVAQRCKVRKTLNLADWLLYVLAYGWLSELVHVKGRDHAPDWHPYAFRNGDTKASHIELVPLRPGEDIDSLLNLARLHEGRDSAHTPVPLKVPAFDDFFDAGPPCIVVLCQSPQYTPKSADVTLAALSAALLTPLPGKDSVRWSALADGACGAPDDK